MLGVEPGGHDHHGTEFRVAGVAQHGGSSVAADGPPPSLRYSVYGITGARGRATPRPRVELPAS